MFYIFFEILDMDSKLFTLNQLSPLFLCCIMITASMLVVASERAKQDTFPVSSLMPEVKRPRLHYVQAPGEKRPEDQLLTPLDDTIIVARLNEMEQEELYSILIQYGTAQSLK